MKKILTQGVALVLCVLLGLALVACNSEVSQTQTSTQTQIEVIDELWADATYTEDKQLGDGQTAISVKVEAGTYSIVFTINTDEKTLAAAMQELELLSGDESEYGLYIKTVNGITADYDVDASYWALYEGEEYVTVGADSLNITDGGSYSLVYTK